MFVTKILSHVTLTVKSHAISCSSLKSFFSLFQFHKKKLSRLIGQCQSLSLFLFRTNFSVRHQNSFDQIHFRVNDFSILTKSDCIFGVKPNYLRGEISCFSRFFANLAPQRSPGHQRSFKVKENGFKFRC